MVYTTYDHEGDRGKHIRHSQLGGGRPVLCAGELCVSLVWDGGVSSSVTMLSDASGHYKPDGRVCLWLACKKLQELGIPMGEKDEGLVWVHTRSWEFGVFPSFLFRVSRIEAITRREHEGARKKDDV